MINSEMILTLPFKITIAIFSFIVWEILSNGEWKQRKRWKACPVGYWQDQAQGSAREIRQTQDYYEKRERDLHADYQQEIKKKEREISYLRSRLYK